MKDKRIAIKVDNISKCYRIGLKDDMPDNLVKGIFNFIKSPLTNYRKYRSLYRFDKEENNSSDMIWALRDVSFEVKEGEIVGIIGINGAGKSTLLKILSKITDPTNGYAEIRGRVSSLLEVGTGFHPDLTGRENVYLNGTILGMRKKEIDRKFDEMVDFSGIEKFIDTPVKRYSSGMKVRLAFAVAAHLEPEILLIDEVLAVGDSQFQKKCMNKMDEVGKQGRTILFVSHNMQAVTRICPRTILLNGGGLQADGPSHQIISSYMDSEMSTRSEREWQDLISAPGDDIVRLCAVRIRTEEGKISDAIDIRQPVGVEIEFEVLQPGHDLFLYYHVVNEEGIEVFTANCTDPEWIGRLRPVGHYVCTGWIPGNFLSEGILYIGPGIWNLNPLFRCLSVHDAVAFHVHDSMEGNTARANWPGELSGVVRPFLNWNTQFSSNKESKDVTFNSSQMNKMEKEV